MLSKHSSLVFTPCPSTKTDSHLAPVTARPTQALSTCNFASSASSPSQLLNALPCNTILVLQHTTDKPSYTKIPHSSYISCFQVSSGAPNGFLTQVAIRKSSRINVTLLIFSPFKLLVKTSIHTSGCCPLPTVWAGMSFWMPSRGTSLPFHRRRKAGSTSQARQYQK